jgi:hypothetical protein
LSREQKAEAESREQRAESREETDHDQPALILVEGVSNDR